MSTLKEKQEQIARQITDENLRHIIFNYEDTVPECFLGSDARCLDYFSSIMTFSVFLIWSAFLEWKKKPSNGKPDGGNSFWRLYNMLDRICDPTKINGGIIDDVLINLEIDCLLDNEESARSFVKIVGLDGFFNFSRSNNKLAQYISLVKQSRVSSRRSAENFNFEIFRSAIGMFPYLRDAKANFSDVEGLCKNSPRLSDLQKVSLDCSDIADSNINTIDFNQSIFVNNAEGYNAAYYMEDFFVNDARRFDKNGNKNQSIIIHYLPFDATRDKFTIFVTDDTECTFDENYAIKKDTAIEDFLLNYDITNTYKSRAGSVFFRDYILLNNRYLKELSYTISDALSVHLKEAIKAKYTRYKEIFDKMYSNSLYGDKEIFGYRWDEIVLFLLLEEGVQEFFRVLLLNGGADAGLVYTDFVKSFERRLGNERIERILNSEKLKKEELKRRLPPGSSRYAEIDCFAKALVLLATKALTQYDWALEQSFYPATIDDIISECEKVNSRQFEKQEKVIYFSNVILQVVRFIVKFYKGVFSYASEKKKSLLLLEANNTREARERYIKEKEGWIQSIARTESRARSGAEIKYFSSNQKETIEKVRDAFKQLIALNDQYSSHSDIQSEILFETLGRKYLFLSDKMQSFGDEFSKILSSTSDKTAELLYEKLKQFLLYLKTGMDNDQMKSMQEDLIETAIYPIVGQYCSGITSFDGYQYSLFRMRSLNQFDNSKVITIKMITDDVFDFGSCYYCIPNINRIANVQQGHTYDKIWVSPIIIPCSVFSSQSFSILEKLSEEDFAAAIELIYESDPFIYGSLFESLENAKKILQRLLVNPNSKFYKNHYRIIRKNGEIVAIAALYEYSNSFYDKSLIKIEADRAGIQLPSTFEKAIEGLRKTFVDDFPGGNYYHIDDVCVKKDYRHQGIGRSLMLGVLKEAESKDMSTRLFVYIENNVAYGLYSSLGFFPIKKQFTVGEDKAYFQMVKV